MNFRQAIKPEIRESLERYINKGVEPGGFLRAVLSNDLKESFGRADFSNREHLFIIVGYLYNFVPSGCWGSPAKVSAWLALDDEERGKILSMRTPQKEDDET